MWLSKFLFLFYRKDFKFYLNHINNKISNYKYLSICLSSKSKIIVFDV